MQYNIDYCITMCYTTIVKGSGYMSLLATIQEDIKIKYKQKLKQELDKKNPNYIEIDFLQKVLKRIEEGKLF